MKYPLKSTAAAAIVIAALFALSSCGDNKNRSGAGINPPSATETLAAKTTTLADSSILTFVSAPETPTPPHTAPAIGAQADDTSAPVVSRVEQFRANRPIAGVEKEGYNLTIHFDEEVMGLAAADLTMSNLTLHEITPGAEVLTDHYRIDITLIDPNAGSVLKMNANAVTDNSSNANPNAEVDLFRAAFIDDSRPSIAFHRIPANHNGIDPFTLTAVFSRGVWGFNDSERDLTLTNATAIIAPSNSGGRTYNITLTPTLTDADTPNTEAITLFINENASGNTTADIGDSKPTNLISETITIPYAQPPEIIVHTEPLTATLTPTTYNGDGYFYVTATFSRPVVRPLGDAVEISGGKFVSATPATGRNTVYRLGFQPDMGNENAISISLRGGKPVRVDGERRGGVSDSQGNYNQASDTVSIEYNGPQSFVSYHFRDSGNVPITQSRGPNLLMTLNLVFAENISLTGEGEIGYTLGHQATTAPRILMQGSVLPTPLKTLQISFTASDREAVMFVVPEGFVSALDGTRNKRQEFTLSAAPPIAPFPDPFGHKFRDNTGVPIFTIMNSLASNTALLGLEVDFSSVRGVRLSGEGAISFSGARQANSQDIEVRFDTLHIPFNDTDDVAAVTITVPAGFLITADEVGNEPLEFTLDATPQARLISHQFTDPEGAIITKSHVDVEGLLTLDILFSHPIRLTGEGGITYTGAQVVNAPEIPVESPNTLRITFKDFLPGALTISIPAGFVMASASDEVNLPLEFMLESEPRALLFLRDVHDTHSGNAFSVRLIFDEPVSGFDVTDIPPTNAIITVSEMNQNRNFTLTVQPDESNGDIRIFIPANVAVNDMDNGNIASVEVVVRYQPPSVQLINTPDSYDNTNPFTITARFSEAVSGFDATDVAVTNASVEVTGVTGGHDYQIMVTPDASGLDIRLSVKENAATNAADNGNSASAEVVITMPRFYLADNGITIMAREGVAVGATGLLGGVEYTLVDMNALRDRLVAGDDVSRVVTTGITDMANITGGQHVNGDISGWDVSSVTNMRGMFAGSSAFRQDLSAWDVSQVINMSGMFLGTEFNSDISGWDVSSVTDMSGMFAEVTAFDQDLSRWMVSQVRICTSFSLSTSEEWTAAEKPVFPESSNCYVDPDG